MNSKHLILTNYELKYNDEFIDVYCNDEIIETVTNTKLLTELLDKIETLKLDNALLVTQKKS